MNSSNFNANDLRKLSEQISSLFNEMIANIKTISEKCSSMKGFVASGDSDLGNKWELFSTSLSGPQTALGKIVDNVVERLKTFIESTVMNEKEMQQELSKLTTYLDEFGSLGKEIAAFFGGAGLIGGGIVITSPPVAQLLYGPAPPPTATAAVGAGAASGIAGFPGLSDTWRQTGEPTVSTQTGENGSTVTTTVLKETNSEGAVRTTTTTVTKTPLEGGGYKELTETSTQIRYRGTLPAGTEIPGIPNTGKTTVEQLPSGGTRTTNVTTTPIEGGGSKTTTTVVTEIPNSSGGMTRRTEVSTSTIAPTTSVVGTVGSSATETGTGRESTTFGFASGPGSDSATTLIPSRRPTPTTTDTPAPSSSAAPTPIVTPETDNTRQRTIPGFAGLTSQIVTPGLRTSIPKGSSSLRGLPVVATADTIGIPRLASGTGAGHGRTTLTGLDRSPTNPSLPSHLTDLLSSGSTDSPSSSGVNTKVGRTVVQPDTSYEIW